MWLFSHWVVSDALWPHGLQHIRLPCSSLGSDSLSVYPHIPHFCSILHFVALPKYYAEGEFLSPRKIENAFSLSPHLTDSFSGQRVLDCKGYILSLWEVCLLTSQSCCWERHSRTFGIRRLRVRPVFSLWKVLSAFYPCSEISLWFSLGSFIL